MNFQMILLGCLMTLLFTIYSDATSPIPTNPAIKIKFTTKGLEMIVSKFTNKMKHRQENEYKIPIEFKLDEHMFDGTANLVSMPKIELLPIPNVREAESYEGYERVHVETRVKRDVSSTHAKAVWQDNDYLASKHIGGLKLIAKEFAFQLNLTKGNSNISVECTDVTLVLSAYMGQLEGGPKLARIAVEIDGNLKMMKNGQEVILTNEERNQKAQDFLAFYITQGKIMFSEFVEDFVPVVGSHIIPHAIFDFRLTEDPQFKDDGVEFSFVGKFIYDKESHYKVKYLNEADFFISEWKKLQIGSEDIFRKDNTYTEKFVVHDDENTPITITLANEGSDEVEAARMKKGCVVLTLKDDFLNSFFEVASKSGLLNQSFSKTKMSRFLQHMNLPENEYFRILPQDAMFNVKLNPVEENKYFTFTEGGMEVRMPFGTEITGLHANYTCFEKSKILFRNGRFARDFQSCYIEKVAEEAYPRIMTEESVKQLHLKSTEDIGRLFSDPTLCGFVSEFAFHPGSFTLGYDCNHSI